MSVIKGSINSPQELFAGQTSQGIDLGAEVVTGDGRAYRYVLAGSIALVAGKLNVSSGEVTTLEGLAIAASAAAATTVTTTTTVTVTANQFAGGYLVTASLTGKGFTYKIKSHPAATAAVVTFTLEDPISVALDTTTTVTVVANPYANVRVSYLNNFNAVPVGVPVFNLAAANYGWVQSRGPVGILADDAIAVGIGVQQSDVVDGAITPQGVGGTIPNIGIAMQAITDTNYGPVFLLLR